MRKALYPPSMGAKDDPRDADLVLDLLLQHRDKLRPLMPDKEVNRRIQNLVEERRKLVVPEVSAAKFSTNGRDARCHSRHGHAPTASKSETEVKTTAQRCAPRLSTGFASYFDAGKMLLR
jgi:hypothetical protein